DELRGVRVFELDHPGTQARKIELLATSNTALPANVTLIGIDFAKQSFRELLPQHGFRRDAVARWLEKIGESFLFVLEPANASRFLAQRGLRVTSHVGPADLERLY